MRSAALHWLVRRMPAAMLWAALLPALPTRAAAPDVGKHAAALQACPAVKQEIVDLDMLAQGLKDSNAVGMFEKLRLKSAIDDLLDRMKAYHQGAKRFTLAELQEQYDLLMMRIAQQLQDKDLPLQGRLCNAWDSVWATLQDRQRFMEMAS
jgi:hypothetical protein